MVKPTPQNNATPNKRGQVMFGGNLVHLNNNTIVENNITPSALPINKPKKMPNGIGSNRRLKLMPSKAMPPFTKANIGRIAKATQGCSLWMVSSSNECLRFRVL